jgi:AraC-like DNA-binding protein
MVAPVVHRSETPNGAWTLATRPPMTPLRAMLREPYYGYVETTPGPLRRREYPGLRFVLIIELGPPLSLISERGALTGHAHGFVAAVRTSSVLTQHSGLSSGIQVNLTPTAARALFAMPLSELAGQVIALDDLLAPAERDILAQVREAEHWEQRFDLVDRLLVRRWLRSDRADAALHSALRMMMHAPERVRIGELAHAFGCSHRKLIERFEDHVGLTPKLVLRLARFERAIALLRQGSRLKLAELAAAVGYYDEAHLARDFREFASSTPGETRADIASTGLPVDLDAALRS